MNVLTDDPSFANDIMHSTSQWDCVNDSQLPGVNQIHQEIFKDKSQLYSKSLQDSFWNYGWFVKHSVQSQLEILTKFSGKGVSLPDRLICLAGSGDHFKGYRNRSWETVPGNLHLTVHFAPNQEIEHFFSGFLMLAAVSVIQTMSGFSGLTGKLAIKWVNDIIIDKAKVAGVLTHTASKGKMVTSALLGIGINVLTVPNVKSDDFVPEVTSLHMHLKETPSLKMVFRKLLDAVQENYILLLDGKHDQILSAYRHYSAVLGENIKVYSDPVSGNSQFIASGVVEEITPNLELKFTGQIKSIRSGRVVI